MLDANLFSFKISADALRKAVKSLSSIVPKMPLPPIVGNILLTLQPDGLLRLQATDINSHIVILLPTIDPVGTGAMCVPSEKLRSISDSVKTGDVLINVNLEHFDMLVSAGRKDASVKGFDALLFPSLDSVAKNKPNTVAMATIPVDLLRDMVKKVAIAAAVDDNRAYLTGIQVTFENDKLVMVATDSFRAAFAECEALGQPNLSTILPASSLKGAVDILSELSNTDNVSIVILENSVQLVSDNITVQLTPLSGIYPKVMGAFAAQQKVSIVIDTRSMLESIRFVTAFQGNLIITTEANGKDKGLLKMYCTDGQSGEGSDAVDIVLKGGLVKLTMNAAYLEAHISLYQQLKIPELMLQFSGNNTPMVIRPYFDGDVDNSFASIVMPIAEDKKV